MVQVPPQPAKALIFDMDGVIIDSTAPHVEAWERYLASHGLEAQNVSGRMLGRHNDEIVRDFFAGRDLSEGDVLRHGAEKERLYREMLAPGLMERLVPGLADFVKLHSDLPLAVATNAEPANVDFVLAEAGIRGHFRAVVNGADVQRPKPAPDIFLRAAELLGAAPESCIVFEDSTTGVAAAAAAGMRVVGVLTTLDRLAGADLCIRDFCDPDLEPWMRSALSR